MRKYAVILLFALAPLTSMAAGPKLKGSDVYFGYSRTANDTFNRGAGELNGWEGALHIHFAPFLGGEADVAQYGYGTSSEIPRTTTVMFGPRVTLKVLRIGLFAHGLGGLAHSSNSSSSAAPVSGTAFSYALGGGIDLPIFPYFALRFAGDRISSTASPEEGTKARFSTGLVFRF